MDKDFQNLDDDLRRRRQLTQAGIRPASTSSSAIPAKASRSAANPSTLMMNICRHYPGAEFWTNIFTPYPGSPIMKRAFELGIEVPKTLEGWSDFFPRYTVLPWLKGRDHERLQNMREYMRVAFHRIPIGKYRTGALNRAALRPDQRARTLASRSSRLLIPRGTLGAQDGAKDSDPAQAEGGCPSAFRRAGHLLGTRWRYPAHPFQSPLLRPQAGAQDAAVSAAADPARRRLPAPRRVSRWRFSTRTLEAPETVSNRRSRCIGRGSSPSARTISTS